MEMGSSFCFPFFFFFLYIHTYIGGGAKADGNGLFRRRHCGGIGALSTQL
jgi:hypothetical protein